MKAPNFICLGAQKAGTTTLHDILKQHPDIYLPKDKEAPFFSVDETYGNGMDWWLNHYFSDYNNEEVLGVMTPEYLYYDEVPNRILENCGPETKLIIILRQPVDRAYSHYLMSKRRGFEPLSFPEAIAAESERIKKGDFERNHFSYIGRSKYFDQVKRYQGNFNVNNILILDFENDIRTNIDLTISRILTFLDVKQMKLQTDIKSNPATEMRSNTAQQVFVKQSAIKSIFKSIIPTKARRWLRNKIIGINQKKLSDDKRLSSDEKKHYYTSLFQSDKEELETITGLDLNHWEPK